MIAMKYTSFFTAPGTRTTHHMTLLSPKICDRSCSGSVRCTFLLQAYEDCSLDYSTPQSGVFLTRLIKIRKIHSACWEFEVKLNMHYACYFLHP